MLVLAETYLRSSDVHKATYGYSNVVKTSSLDIWTSLSKSFNTNSIKN